MKLTMEKVTLVVKLQNLGILDQQRERSAHEFGIVSHQVVENLAMFLCEMEEQSLHFGLWWRAGQGELFLLAYWSLA
jgi:hypothetical protein